MVLEERADSDVAVVEHVEDESLNSHPILPAPIRHSMDEYYQHHRSIEPEDSPPSYDELLDSPSVRRRFNIQPREDEGRETLPPYSSAISIQSVFMRKMELENAVHRSQDRNWYRVIVTLQGTLLTFHKCKNAGLFPRDGKDRPDFPTGAKKGLFLRSYNLQHADVGIAADYLKKRFVIRVRAEDQQFLLSCHKIETFVLWLQSLFAAIDLAPPLDDREIPRDLSIPRRARRRVRVELADVVREQEEIISSQFPGLARGDSVEAEAEASSQAGEGEDEAEDELSSLPPPTPVSTPTRPLTSRQRPHAISSISSPPPAPNILSRARNALQSQSSPNLTSSTPNPSITADGKWAPHHQWTHFYDMMYAKRCMAILTHRSPRKSNLVIMKGKRWIIDWGTGSLTREAPPDYGEIAGKIGEPSVQSITRNPSLVRT